MPQHPDKNTRQSAPLVLIGGSFDPVHVGHISMAERLQASIPQAHICFLPTAGSPFKRTQTSAKHRLAMLRLALRDTTFGVDTTDLKGTPPTFTLDTLQHIRRRIGPSRPIIFALGEDSFRSLPRWKGEFSLLAYAHLWVFGRATQSLPAVTISQTASNAQLQELARLFPELESRLVSTPSHLFATPAGSIFLDVFIPPPISSTLLRDALAEHLGTSVGLVPRRVLRYIQQSNLYGN